MGVDGAWAAMVWLRKGMTKTGCGGRKKLCDIPKDAQFNIELNWRKKMGIEIGSLM